MFFFLKLPLLLAKILIRETVLISFHVLSLISQYVTCISSRANGQVSQLKRPSSGNQCKVRNTVSIHLKECFYSLYILAFFPYNVNYEKNSSVCPLAIFDLSLECVMPSLSVYFIISLK